MDLRKFAINLAKKAGKIIRDNFTIGMKKEWKEDETPLTVTDQSINHLVERAVKEYFPKHGLLAEEGGNFNQSASYVWVCDPLDGTLPFSHGVPVCTFSLALVHEGVPQLGVIFDPFLNRLFFSQKSKGAFLNDRPIKVSDLNNLKKGVVGFTIWRQARYDLTEFIGLLIKSCSQIIAIGPTTYMAALVAGGEFVANVWPGKTPWDIAAVKVIVEEAGGRVTDFFGHDQRYDAHIRGSIASNERVHDHLVEMIRESGIKP